MVVVLEPCGDVRAKGGGARSVAYCNLYLLIDPLRHCRHKQALFRRLNAQILCRRLPARAAPREDVDSLWGISLDSVGLFRSEKRCIASLVV